MEVQKVVSKHTKNQQNSTKTLYSIVFLARTNAEGRPKRVQKGHFFNCGKHLQSHFWGAIWDPPRTDNSSIRVPPKSKLNDERSQKSWIVNSGPPRRAPLRSGRMGLKSKKASKKTFPEFIFVFFGIFTKPYVLQHFWHFLARDGNENTPKWRSKRAPKTLETVCFMVFLAIWAASGRLLYGLLSSGLPGQLLDGFWTASGQLLDGFWTASGRLLDGSEYAIAWCQKHYVFPEIL